MIAGCRTKCGINYDKAKDVTRRVEQGELEIIRLDRGGEQGRLVGGARTLEATVLLGADEQRYQASSQRGGSNVESRPDTSIGREERIESLIKNEIIWGDVGEILRKWVSLKSYFCEGGSAGGESVCLCSTSNIHLAA